MNTINLAVWHLTPSRLKPALQVRVTARLRGMHAIAFSGTGFSREEAFLDTMIVPTLRVAMHPPTLRVKAMDAERPGRHPHAERGNDQRYGC